MAGMRRMRLFDCLLRVRDEPEPAPSGRLAAPPLVCIHGAGMSSVVFMDLLRRFAPGRRVIAPDLPGHGQSQRRPMAATLDGYRDTVRALCDALSLPRIVLVGHSLGSAIALSLALMDPARVSGLVLLNGCAQLGVPDEIAALVQRSLPSAEPRAMASVGDVAAGALPDGFPEVFIDRMPDAFADLVFSPATPKELRQRFQAMLWSADAATLLADFAVCRDLDLRPQLERAALGIPTLCIAGRDDLLVPVSRVSETAARIPGAELHILDRSAHLSHVEQAAAVFAILDTWLRERVASRKVQGNSELAVARHGSG